MEGDGRMKIEDYLGMTALACLIFIILMLPVFTLNMSNTSLLAIFISGLFVFGIGACAIGASKDFCEEEK